MRKLLLLLAALAFSFGLVLAQADDETDESSDDAAHTQLEDMLTVQLGTEGFLVDGDGRALYLFTNDSPGVSTCVDTCLVNWPPLLFTGELSGGMALDSDLLDTIERDDSTVQVTYNGWPLYHYIGDVEAGATTGQGVGDVWFLVDVDGNAINPTDDDPAGDDAGNDG